MTGDDAARRIAYHKAVQSILQVYHAAADAIAADFNEDRPSVIATLAFTVARQFDDGSRNVADSRTQLWRCRFRIYDNRHMDEPVADSDDGEPADRAGSMTISGLPNVINEAHLLAQAFHEHRALVGFGSEERAKRLRGFRPTISRNDGRGVLRLPYDTLETFNTQSIRRGWLMRVDVIRETQETTNDESE